MNFRPFKVVFLYLIAGLCWIIITDQLVKYIGASLSLNQMVFWQSFKGISFVAATAIILYFIIKKQHETLAGSEKQYRDLFSGNPTPVWIYNSRTFEFVEVNAAAIAKYQYSRDEFLSMTILDIWPVQDREKVIALIKNDQSSELISGVWTHKNKLGESFSVFVKSFSVKFNNQECAIVLAADITEKLKQQNQLEESYRKEIELNEALAAHIDLIRRSAEENRRMAEIIDKINNLVIFIGRDGELKWVNKAFTQLTGYAQADITGKRPSDLLFGPGTDLETAAKLKTAVQNEEFFSCELINYTKDKQEYWTQINLSPIYDESGHLDCFISVEAVITERKIREEKIKIQNQTLRQLAWVSSHEIRRPVTSMISLIQLVKTLDEGDEKKECLKLLEESAIQLDNLVRDIAKRVNVAEDEQPLI